MILSCSRRTDIPAFYSEWFINRLRMQSVCVVNPFNTNQLSRIIISSEVVDCIVFWTKNPKPIMQYLDEIDQMGYIYYFHYTITPYQRDIEPGISNKADVIQTFIELSERIGKEKVILRYDPILITEKYDVVYHEKAFKKLCERLEGYTEKVVISFVDEYRKNKSSLESIGIVQMDIKAMQVIAEKLKVIADMHNIVMETCAESVELNYLNIPHGKCIDGELIERIVGYKIINKDKKDANRENCGCMQCIDIGQYDTCLHNCSYCYANVNPDLVVQNHKLHNPLSEILIGEVDEMKVTQRKNVKSFRINEDYQQMRFDL